MKVLILFSDLNPPPSFLKDKNLPDNLAWETQLCTYGEPLEKADFCLCFAPLPMFLPTLPCVIEHEDQGSRRGIAQFYQTTPSSEASFKLQTVNDYISLCESIFGVLGIDTPSRRKGHSDCGYANLFLKEEELYLASSDRILSLIDQFNRVKKNLSEGRIDHFISVVGGLGALQALLFIEPKEITFFDCNYFAIPYLKLILELIELSLKPSDFIRRIYGRDIFQSISGKGFDDLTLLSQNTYLSTARDSMIDQQTLKELSTESSKLFDRYFISQVVKWEYAQKLLPCWNLAEVVPVNIWGECEKNINTFFYGHGWLSHQESFNLLKNRLRKAQLHFTYWDITRQTLPPWVDFSASNLLFLSNIDEFFMQETTNSLLSINKEVGKHGGIFYWSSISAYGGVKRNPHATALKEVESMVQGRCLEVTHKVPWGFSELKDNTNVHITDYLEGEFFSDTCILHCLLSEGVDENVFITLLDKALSQSKRLLILEHQAGSKDWGVKTPPKLVCRKELIKYMKQAPRSEKREIKFNDIPGIFDSKRNLLCSII